MKYGLVSLFSGCGGLDYGFKKAGFVLRYACDNDPAAARMGFVNAEITKLALNNFVTTKISFANMLARICEKMPGGDVDVVTGALGLDSRISPKYLKGATGYGGPCFPRDNVALSACARSLDLPGDLIEATRAFNFGETERLKNLVKKHMPLQLVKL